MATGNAGNTVFTAIPVGEDFKMSFPTNRFYHYIKTNDIVSVIFKLYDARQVKSVDNPDDTALILEKNNQPYNVDSNPNGAPSLFTISDTDVKVLVQSSVLDAWAVANDINGDPSAVFRGELYGYINLIVRGAETNEFIELDPLPITPTMTITAAFDPFVEPWDGYFYATDGVVNAAMTVTGPSQLRLASDP